MTNKWIHHLCCILLIAKEVGFGYMSLLKGHDKDDNCVTEEH